MAHLTIFSFSNQSGLVDPDKNTSKKSPSTTRKNQTDERQKTRKPPQKNSRKSLSTDPRKPITSLSLPPSQNRMELIKTGTGRCKSKKIKTRSISKWRPRNKRILPAILPTSTTNNDLETSKPWGPNSYQQARNPARNKAVFSITLSETHSTSRGATAFPTSYLPITWPAW